MTQYAGSENAHPDPTIAKAYSAGRKASVAAAAIGTNPHTAGTPEYVAWRNGHVMYASAGANTVADNCAEPAKFNTPAVTPANYTTDATGATHQFTPAAPGLPFTIDFGDGTSAENPPASVAILLHKYPASGTYSVSLVLLGKVWATYSVVKTIT